MRTMFQILTLLLSVIVFSQNYEITYKVGQEVEWTEEMKEDFLKNHTDKAEGLNQMRQNTHPEPVVYKLLIDNEKQYSEFKFVPKLRNDQDQGAIITVAPAGFGSTFRKTFETNYLKVVDVYGRSMTVKEKLPFIERVSAPKKDNSILNLETYYIEAKDSLSTYKIWFSPQIQGFNIHNFDLKEGLILKLERYFERNGVIGVQKYEAIEIQEPKRLRIGRMPKDENTITSKELEKMFEKINRERNEMNRSTDIDKE